MGREVPISGLSSGVGDRLVTALCVGIFLAVASVYGVPQALDPNLVKVGLAGFEIAAVLAAVRLARFETQRDFFLLALVVAAVGSKTLYGILVAAAVWGVPYLDAIIEARFGFALCALPIILRLFDRCSKREVEYLLLGFTGCLILLDISAVLLFPDLNLLSFGQRGAERFIISTMGVAGIAYFYLSKCSLLGVRRGKFLTALVVLWILHVFLITTSRADAAVLSGLLIAVILNISRVPQKYILAAIALSMPVILVLVGIFVSQGQTVGGRDVFYFIRELTDSLPAGVGFLPDSTRNASVVYFTPIFASDYGVGLYVYRYGLVSVGIFAALGLVIFKGVRGALHVDGAPVFLIAILAYIIVIPFWEYGSLNGALLTAALLGVARLPQANLASSN